MEAWNKDEKWLKKWKIWKRENICFGKNTFCAYKTQQQLRERREDTCLGITSAIEKYLQVIYCFSLCSLQNHASLFFFFSPLQTFHSPSVLFPFVCFSYPPYIEDMKALEDLIGALRNWISKFEVSLNQGDDWLTTSARNELRPFVDIRCFFLPFWRLSL